MATTELKTGSAASRTVSGDAAVAAFLLGGIGTGNVSIGARGELRDWEIFNGPGKGKRLPYTFFALRIAPEGGEARAKILESRLRPPHESWTGSPFGSLAGLPRFFDSRLRGEYPFVWVDFIDDELPVAASLEAFTPLVPLDAEASSLPAALLRYRVRNLTDAAMEVTVAASLFNPIGCQYQTRDAGFELTSHLEGTPTTDYRVDGDLHGLFMSSSLSVDDLRHGTLALLTADGDVTATPRWPISHEAASDFWRDLEDDGRLEPTLKARPMIEGDMPLMDVVAEETREKWAKLHAASLASTASVAPGEERAFEFVLAWHFPNRPRSWTLETGGDHILEPTNADQIVCNHYATRFEDAWAVGRHLVSNLSPLESATRSFHESLYGSTLPPEVIDAAASNITVLRSTTCFWLEDDTFAAWEGCADDVGVCEGSCTHVWNYAQTGAFLFPELERSMRRVEFGLETEPDGKMNIRTNRIFGGKPYGGPPAVDGQLGTIVRLYREWKFSGDDEFLAELWPNAAKALEFAFGYWDGDGDFVLEGAQYTTYDVPFYGPNSLGNAMFYAALRAGAEMAEHLGEQDRAERYRHAAERGAARMDELLWNGEYYIQLLDDIDAQPDQYGSGCMSDQLFGQLLAHITGLGYVLPAEHVHEAIASVHRYNFRPQLRDHLNFLRTYALEDESGLVICSWPHGGRPHRPFAFCDEVWTGSEYQVAAHLIYEGLVDEGLEIVRAVRARHDGHRRNQWNEAEAGNHYARSLSSWALLLAHSGFRYDATKRAIGFAPAVAGDFRCFFSTGSGWGTFERTSDSSQLRLKYGSLVLSQVDIDGSQRVYDKSVTLKADDVLTID